MDENLPAVQEMLVGSTPGGEDPLEEVLATHSSSLFSILCIVLGVQQSDSVFFQHILHYMFIQDNGYNFLCCPVRPYCLSILVVCVC